MNNSENHIQYKLIRSNRKTLSMSINNTPEIIVKSPINLCDKKIYEWVQSKKIWIEKHLNIIKNKEKHKNIYQQKCYYEIGKQIPYIGGLIYLKDNKEININNIFFDGQYLYINSKKDVKIQVESWYKQEAQKLYINLLNYWKIKMNVNFTNFKIGQGKKRLGFCNSKAEICISWYLIMQPLYVIEYVIVHELAHLVHFNHSPLFWNLVNYYYPNYIKAEHYLKTKGVVYLSS